MSAPSEIKPPEGTPIQVMVVDDSVVIRGFLTRFIESDPGIKVIASVSNGELAVNKMERTPFDVVVLDIDMPVMDGMTALPLILKADPCVHVIMASTLTTENAAITMKALQMGAAECLAKPTSQELAESSTFRDSLVEKIRTLGLMARKKREAVVRAAPPSGAASQPAVKPPAALKKFTTRPEIGRIIPEVIAIGSSTGGPQALMQFFSELKGELKQPVFVTQHMPPTFTAVLAGHIAKQSGLKCAEAVDGEPIQERHIYLAPGNFHMTVKEREGKRVIALNQDAPESFCRPAVDPMLRSLVDVYKNRVLAVIFTGMGSDGQRGCQRVVDTGGIVLAQDEASSVVWGMPGAVAMSGLCTHVLPLGMMAKAVRGYADFGSAS